jgi:hypothetical protein
VSDDEVFHVDAEAQDSDGDELGEEGTMDNDLEPLDENVYGLALASLLRDSLWLAKSTTTLELRIARLISVMCLVVFTISIQVFLLWAVARLLCRKAVVDIRANYGEYEHVMYDNHTELTANGHHRGIPGYFSAANFALLGEDLQASVCEIPLAHPKYITVILFVWSLTCMQHVRNTCEQTTRLIWNTPRSKTLVKGMKVYPEVSSSRSAETLSLEVVGLPCKMKFAVMILILLPRIATLLALLFYGCRWLLATADLGEVFLNAVALEFVINLPDVMHNVLAPNRSKKAVLNTFIKPYRDKESVTCCTMFDAYGWVVVAFVWVVLYVFQLQTVLPDYRWDVRDVCNSNEAVVSF